MYKNERNFFFGIWGGEEESGVVGETGGEGDLDDIDIVEVAHLPIKSRGWGPIDSDRELVFANLNARDPSAENETSGGRLVGEVEKNGEVQWDSCGRGKFKSAFCSARCCFPPDKRDAESGIDMSFSNALHGNA